MQSLDLAKIDLSKGVTYSQEMVNSLFDSLKIFYKDINGKVDGVEGKIKSDTDHDLNHVRDQIKDLLKKRYKKKNTKIYTTEIYNIVLVLFLDKKGPKT